MGVDIPKDASFDCWLSALNNVEVHTTSHEVYTSIDHNHGVELSPGGNFCAQMRSGSQLDFLAFELTKCEYEKFSEPLPNNCSFDGSLPPGTNTEAFLRTCLSSLSKDTWLGVWTAFTQYKISSYSLCNKLTEELMLHRQQKTAYQLEKTIIDMEGKLGEVLSKADVQFMEKVNLMGNKIEDMKQVSFVISWVMDGTPYVEFH